MPIAQNDETLTPAKFAARFLAGLLLLVAGVFFAFGLAGPGVSLTVGLLTTGCVYSPIYITLARE